MSTNPWPNTAHQLPNAPPAFYESGIARIERETVLKQTRPKNIWIQEISAITTSHGWPEGSVRTNISFLERKLVNSPEHVQRAVAIDPGVMHGNPVFRGTRVPVYQIIEELADGTGLEELPDCFPSLTPKKIQAGLDFAVRLLRIYDE